MNELIGKQETCESLAGKAMQMHELSKNFTHMLTKQIHDMGKDCEFGETFSYNKIYQGMIKNGSNMEAVVVEDFIPGICKKYINNEVQQSLELQKIWNSY